MLPWLIPWLTTQKQLARTELLVLPAGARSGNEFHTHACQRPDRVPYIVDGLLQSFLTDIQGIRGCSLHACGQFVACDASLKIGVTPRLTLQVCRAFKAFAGRL